MASVKRIAGFLSILGPDQQISSSQTRIHPAGIVRPDHGLDPDLVQNAFGYLSIRR